MTRGGYGGRFVRGLACALACAGWNARAADTLAVFLADNHAETFGWIARTVDLDRPHTLVLVDAHSDATCAVRSDELRDGLRRVTDDKDLCGRIEEWRTSGRIQAFNWIEPLLPRPLDGVIRVAAPRLEGGRKTALQNEACEALDGRLGFELRSAASFARRWQTWDVRDLKAWKPGERQIILALDLDFFADMTRENRDAVFGEIWKSAMDWPGLAGVAIAVSRPWLKDDAQADELVWMALDAVRRTRGTRVTLDFSLDNRPDDSLKGAGLRSHGKSVPCWDAGNASMALQSLLVAQRGEWRIGDRLRDWEKMMDRWADASPKAALTADGGCPDADGVWRFPAGDVPVLRVVPPDGIVASGRVRWHLLDAARNAYNLMPQSGLGKEFSVAPGRWIYQEKRVLAMTTDFALAPGAWASARSGCGRYLIGADYETSHGWLTAGDMEMRLVEGDGFHAGLSECFRMPYAFGIALVNASGNGGVDTGWGSDCSNMLVHAWRRSGHRLAWGDPGRVSDGLSCIAAQVGVQDRVPVTPAQIRDGVAVNFGRHMAALWEDRPPMGILDGGDLMAHHLGGVPEVVELRTLAAARPEFSVLVPKRGKTCSLAILGDLVMTGVEEKDVSAALRSPGSVDLVLGNLEGPPSRLPEGPARRYDFHFPPERLAWLATTGVGVVSLANNHAADAGREKLTAAVAAVRAAGIGAVGAGDHPAESCQPWRGERNGVKLAVFGICITDAPVAGQGGAGVAHLPEHADALEHAMTDCRNRGEVILMMIHWGDEYSRTVNDEQRYWSHWLTERGACVVAGSHPHVTQPLDWHAGGVTANSLGNMIYPAWLGSLGDGAVWHVTIDEFGGIVDCKLVPARR